jgi:hypothetical protein
VRKSRPLTTGQFLVVVSGDVCNFYPTSEGPHKSHLAWADRFVMGSAQMS